MNDGKDTSFYLHQGYRVVAIEANPMLIDRARQRFASQLAQGNLILLNVGIGPCEGIAPFWICEENSELSSFDRTQASYNGRKSYTVKVRRVRFGDVMDEFGTPHYAKIDIEGSDVYCLQDLDRVTAPDYISVELGNSPAEIMALKGLGYDSFKCINQRDFRQLRYEGRGLGTRLRGAVRSHHSIRQFGVSFSAKSRSLKDKLLNQYRGLISNVQRLDWTFEEGSSGPFGEQPDGEWQSMEEACHAWLHYLLGHSKFGRNPEWTYWHDVHAKRGRNRISRCDPRGCSSGTLPPTQRDLCGRVPRSTFWMTTTMVARVSPAGLAGVEHSMRSLFPSVLRYPVGCQRVLGVVQSGGGSRLSYVPDQLILCNVFLFPSR